MSKESDLSNAIDAYLEKRAGKPVVLKPGSPEHAKAMAAIEAAKATKHSKNPAGQDTPSRPESRAKFGDRPLVQGIDKQEAMGPFTKSVDLEDGSHSWDYQG